MPKASTPTQNNGTSIPVVPTFDIEPVFSAHQRGLKAISEAQEHMFHSMAKVSGELFHFVDRRLENDRETARQLAGCKSPQEAAAVYGKFFETAMQQYSREMGLLAGLYADQAREAIEDVQHQVEETVNVETAGSTPPTK